MKILLHHVKDGHDVTYESDLNGKKFTDIEHAQRDGKLTCEKFGGTFFVSQEAGTDEYRLTHTVGGKKTVTTTDAAGKKFASIDEAYTYGKKLTAEHGGNIAVERVAKSSSTTSSTTTNWKNCKHDAIQPVMIGGYPVHLGAGRDIAGKEVLDVVDYVVTLSGYIPQNTFFGQCIQLIDATLQDHGGVPENWSGFITNMVEVIKSGKKIVAYCIGSHGRTGCFAASLIAVMEPEVEDPIAEIRKRHCKHAVESLAQAEAIFALKGQELPEKYVKEFTKYTSSGAGYGWGSNWSSHGKKKDSQTSTTTITGAVGSSDATFDAWWAKWRESLIDQWKGYFPHLTGDARETRIRAIYRETYHTTDATDEYFQKQVEQASQEAAAAESNTDPTDEESSLSSDRLVECVWCPTRKPRHELINLGDGDYCCMECFADLGEDDDDDEFVSQAVVENGEERLREWKEELEAAMQAAIAKDDVEIHPPLSQAAVSAIEAGDDIDY